MNSRIPIRESHTIKEHWGTFADTYAYNEMVSDTLTAEEFDRMVFPSKTYAIWFAEFVDPITGELLTTMSAAVKCPGRIGMTYAEFLGSCCNPIPRGYCARIGCRNVDIGLYTGSWKELLGL